MPLNNRWFAMHDCAAVVVWAAMLLAVPASAQSESAWVGRIAPSRPQIQTLWQPPSLPISERDVIDIADRLSLTREQTIAFEAFLPEYQQQACELRRGAIKTIAGEGVTDWSMMRAELPKQAIQKSADARLAYERALATLDSSLFDRLEGVLAAEQQLRLPAERLRRDRQRILTDDMMISVCGDGSLLIDLREVVDSLELPTDQRDAVLALVDTYESQATKRLHDIFEMSVKEGIRMVEALADQDPTGQARMNVTGDRVVLLRKTIEFEEQFVDQIASVLGPEAAPLFRVLHARALPDRYGRGGQNRYWDAMAQAIAAADDLDPALKQQAADLLAKSAKSECDVLPELMHITRITDIYSPPWRPGGIPMMMTSELWESVRPMHERQNELSQKAYEGYRALNAWLANSVPTEQRKAIQEVASKINTEKDRASGLSYEDYQQGLRFGSSNIVTMVSMHSDMMVMSADAQQRRISAMKHLGLDDDAGAVASAAVEDALDRWNESAADVQKRFSPLVRYYGGREAFDAAAHEKSTAEALAALESMRTMVPAAVESLGVVIDNPTLRERAITALLWSDIADPPLNCPAPMDIVRTSHYRTVTTMLDRVDPAATLLELNLSTDEASAAWQVLREEATAGELRVWNLRKLVAEAMAVSARSMMWQQSGMSQRRENGQEMDWSAYQKMQQAATEACRTVQQARREHLKALARLHARIAAALPQTQQTRYVEIVHRLALPDAWIGNDRAQRLTDFALTLPDITDQQRDQALAALALQQEPIHENARAVAAQIEELSDADDMTRDSAKRLAPMHALLEQLAFERDQHVDAMLRLLRPILTVDQMNRVTDFCIRR